MYPLFICILIYLSYQDFKHRSVYWLVFPILFALNFYLNFHAINIVEYVFNLLVVVLQILTVIAYLKFKGLKPLEIFTKYFGLGDLLFLLVLCMSFNLEYFLLFNISTLILAISISYIFKLLTIPFAGIQSASLSIYLLFNIYILK